MSYTLVAALSLCAALALAGCGGGGSADSLQTTDVVAASDAETMKSDPDDLSDSDEIPQAQIQAFRENQDSRWIDESMCEEGQLVGPFDNSSAWSEDNFLVNRHKLCARFTYHSVRMGLEMMAPKDDKEWLKKSWTLYSGQAKDYDRYEYFTFVYGDVVLETHWAAFGAPNVLQKTYAVRTKVSKFTFNGDGDGRFPDAGLNGTLKLSVSPALYCNVNGGERRWSCPSNVIRFPAATLALRAGGQTDWSKEVPVELKYDPTKAEPYGSTGETELRVEYFFVEPWYSDFTVVGCKGSDCNWTAITGGVQNLPMLRCDKGVIGPNRQGCVFPSAAAVMTVDGSKYPDIVSHIASAFANGSPGEFKALPGNDAVSVSDPHHPGLHWAKNDKLKKANRNAACDKTNSGSVISLRISAASPDAYSKSCTPDSRLCSCDEFPFASTMEGGFRNQGWTSAQMVVASQNSDSGVEWGVFLGYQRVLPDAAPQPDAAWIQLKANTSR